MPEPIEGNIARRHSPVEYRPDLDGLRAVAVLSVIFAHAGVPFIQGGFLGVDVFFVISGFLITSILRREMAEKRYSLTQFYLRRARRILPALIPVIAFCVPLAWWLMLPDFRENFGQSVVATLLFSNNILLALTTGYWELESAFKPLLHTWSLGVEEQFYVVFPLLLAGVWAYGRNAQLGMILLLGAISLALSEYGWRHHPDENFYLPTSRAWELMAGCAASYVVRAPEGRWRHNLLAAISLVLIVAPMFVFDEHTPSPSLYSAIPVLGTVGVILFSHEGSATHRVLSLRTVVFVGLISYSAYLWHQPLFAFARVMSLDEPSGWVMAGLSVLTMILAYLSWRFVERPFRKDGTVKTALFVPLAIGVCAILVAIGLVLHFNQGFPRKTYPNIADVDDIGVQSYTERIKQYSAPSFPDNGKADVLLVGNSFGRDVGNILVESGAVEDDDLVYLDNYPACAGDGYWNADNASNLLPEADLVVVALYNDHDERCVELIEQALSAQTDAPLIYFGPKHFGYNINPYGRVPMDRRASVLTTAQEDIVATNNRLAEKLGSERYVDLIRLLGPDGRRLRFYDDRGNPLTPDRIHLTRYGAQMAAERLQEQAPPAFAAIEALNAGESD